MRRIRRQLLVVVQTEIAGHLFLSFYISVFTCFLQRNSSLCLHIILHFITSLLLQVVTCFGVCKFSYVNSTHLFNSMTQGMLEIVLVAYSLSGIKSQTFKLKVVVHA